ncbi:malate:quinone oxidoreductase, partial [Staphylococcus epidermidis]|uniref:malate:quinone oxidoreductase n=1 Tax=Staphylococcus epidermidis TaxID=1282 RepID=UPI0016424F64
KSNLSLKYNHHLLHLTQTQHPKSQVLLQNTQTKQKITKIPHKLFIPPPPHSIPLLQKSPLKQTQHLPPFPITPQFLTSTNPH